ncbi:hypothetical protein CMU71_06855 [Elizabethkingia anophelis]|nr:hypothetical protein [Elizabethkingia anophelis]MDV3939667.1 hypothetical protein [Elizabethkingia anophelis]
MMDMKTLKFISIISFLLIGGVNPKGTINILAFPYMLVEFFAELFNGNLGMDMLLALVIVITLTGTLIIFYKNQNRGLLILCFITLSLFSVFLSGILTSKPNLWFILTAGVFIVSSILLIIRSPKSHV